MLYGVLTSYRSDQRATFQSSDEVSKTDNKLDSFDKCVIKRGVRQDM